MVTTREVTQQVHPRDTKQQPSHDQSREEDNKKENPGGGKDDGNSPKNPKTKEELPEVTNDVYIQIRLLRGVLHYYEQNKLYPYDHPKSLLHFLESWLQDNFIAGSFRETIENLRRKFPSEKQPDGFEGNVEKNIMEEPLRVIDIAIRILAVMVEYYISEKRYPFPDEKYLKDFHKNWLYWRPSCIERWQTIKEAILILKKKYENRVRKKGNGLVLCNNDDLMLFELADIIWGPEGQLSQVEVDMKILAAMIGYYIKNWRYPFEDIEDFHKNWINELVSFDVCTERIKRLKRDWVDKRHDMVDISEVDDLLLFKLSEFIWGSEEPINQVDMDKKTLAAMVDYYTSKWEYPFQKLEYLADFHENWLKMEVTLSESSKRINRLKSKYKEQVRKKGKDLVFSGIDDLELFKLSEVLWGSETESVNHGRLRT